MLSPEKLLIDAAAGLKKRSPGMSLRAVAGRLEISPSYWSKILRGQRPLPEDLLPRVVKVLALDSHQTAQLQRSILQKIETERLSPVTGLRVSINDEKSPVEGFTHYGRDEYWLLEEWYYIPILNLFTLEGFGQTAAEIQSLLGLHHEIALAAVLRLKQHGFLKENAHGVLERTDLQVRFPTNRSLPEVRKYHHTMVSKAREELQKPDAAENFEQRLISAVCFTGASEKMKEARLILEEAMYRAANLMAGEEVTDQVYQLNVQIFPLTKSKSK